MGWNGIWCGISASIDAGNISAGQCSSVLPFNDYVYILMLNGTLYEALNNGVSVWTGNEDASGIFPEISEEFEFSFNPEPDVPQNSMVVNANLVDPVTGECKPSETHDQITLKNNEFVAT